MGLLQENPALLKDPPCMFEYLQTPCIKAFAQAGGKLPCPLFTEGKCKPHEIAKTVELQRQKGSLECERGPRKIEDTLHFDCPISGQVLKQRTEEIVKIQGEFMARVICGRLTIK